MDTLLFIVVLAVVVAAAVLIEAVVFVLHERRRRKEAAQDFRSWEGPRCRRCGGASSFEVGPCYRCRYEEGRLS